MKLITLNIWGGHVQEPLLDFINTHQEVDIFCLQEVYHNALEKISDENREVCLNIFSKIQALLPYHEGFFKPVVNGVYGLSIFASKKIDILSEGEIQIHNNPNYNGIGPAHSRNLQWLECRIQQKTYTIFNVHALWNGQGKKDSPERIAQSEKIKNFIDGINTPKILCGDFNLRPDTRSIEIIEKNMRNLVKLHNIESTRTRYYPKEEKFADYIFTSEDIVVKTFEVLKHEVSDHAPLFLDFD